MNTTLVSIPFVMQGVAMMFDEFYFHRRRGLPKWERIGHPLDTMTVIIPMVWTLGTNFDDSSFVTFIFLSLFSCLFVTKDEFVHAHEAEPMEQWLHAILFVLHPLIFVSIGWLWSQRQIPAIKVTTAVFAVFMFYQLIYWNVIWKPLKK